MTQIQEYFFFEKQLYVVQVQEMVNSCDASDNAITKLTYVPLCP